MTESLKILSLGAGVQSSTVLLMSCIGELPKLDAAVFADTQWEPRRVYEHLAYLEQVAGNYGIPIHRVSAGNLRVDAINSRMRKDDYEKIEGGRWASLPLFTKNADGTTGKIKRQCTKEYKIEPIRREVARLLRTHGLPKTPGIVEQWIGISRDEMGRMRQSDVRYIRNHYPLVMVKPLSRAECIQWLERNDFQIPDKSACMGCPFKSNNEWRKLREVPDEWLDTVDFDKSIRSTGGLRGETFLHRSCVPLNEVDLSTVEERGQRNWLDECSGLCGV